MGFIKRVNVLRHPVFFALPVILGYTLYMIFFKSSLASGDIFGSKKIAHNHSQSASAVKPVPPVPPSSSVPFKNASSARSLPAISSVPTPEYTLVSLSGYLRGHDGSISINVGHFLFKLPSPYVQHVDLHLLTAEVKSTLLALDRGRSPLPAPVVPPVAPAVVATAAPAAPSVAPDHQTLVSFAPEWHLMEGPISHNQSPIQKITQGGEIKW